MRKPALWLAQSEQDALRLVIAGVRDGEGAGCGEHEV